MFCLGPHEVNPSGKITPMALSAAIVRKDMSAADNVQVASNWSKSFDILLDTYKEIAESFPLLLQYRSLFRENSHLQKILVWIYEDLLKFHLRAWRIFAQYSKPSHYPPLFLPLAVHGFGADSRCCAEWTQIFCSTWKDFQASFKPILSDLLRHRELLDCGASLVQIQESRDLRIQSETSFAALMQEQNLTNTRAVINWLSAADPKLDQDVCAATRQDIPDTGRWILKGLVVKDWLDPAECSVPVFWLNGIPGAGKFGFKLINPPLLYTRSDYGRRAKANL